MANRLSNTARKRCAASGAKNLTDWRNRRTEAARERTALAADFRAELMRDCGPNVTAIARALIESAVASYIAIAITSNRFVQGRTQSDTMDTLIRTQGQLNRTLRMLGLKSPMASGDNNDPNANGGDARTPGGIAEWTDRWRRNRSRGDGNAEPPEDAERHAEPMEEEEQ